MEINRVSVRSWSFEKIIRVLRCFDDGVRIRSLGFEVLKDDLAFHGGLHQNRTFHWSVARRRLYSLTSSIASYRVDEDEEDGGGAEADHGGEGEMQQEREGGVQMDDNNHEGPSSPSPTSRHRNHKRKVKVVRYEIKCHLLIRHYQKNDQTINFSIWKRYSELKAIHDDVLLKQFEWQLEGANQGRGIAFPSNRYVSSVFYGSTSDKFLEMRRRELDDYWSLLQTCPDVFDFADPASHRFSKDMADFLEIEKYLHSPELIQADSTTCGGGDDPKSIMTPANRNGNSNGNANANGNIETTKASDTAQGADGSHDKIVQSSSGLGLDISALSEIPPASASVSESAFGSLNESMGRFGEIVVPGGLDPTPYKTPGRNSRTSARSPGTGTGSASQKRRRRTAAAKPAFQRRLLDDL